MANKGKPAPRGSVGDVTKGVGGGGVGSRTPSAPPMPLVQMPRQGPGPTPTSRNKPSPGGDNGAWHRKTAPQPASPKPPKQRPD
jgi:hypothetical protein